MTKRKSFNVQSVALCINGVANSYTKLRQYLDGKKAVVISEGNGHNYGCVGTVFKIQATVNISGGAGDKYNSMSNGIPGGNSINFTHFSVITEETKKDIKDEIAVLRKEKTAKVKEYEELIAESKNKLKYMEESGVDLFDDNEFKIYHTLSVLDNEDLTQLERTKLIANLIK